VTAARERFEWFFRQLYGHAPQGEEGAAALPTTVAETVRALDPRAFTTVARSTLATAPFLQALEESAIPGTSLRYLLVHDEIGPAGFALLTTVQLHLPEVMKDAGGDGAGRRGSSRKELAGDDGKESISRIIVIGHPLFRWNPFLDFRDPQPTPSLLATMVRATYRVRKQEEISVSLIKDLPDADVARIAPIEGYGYVRFETQPGLVLRIDPKWKGFGGWLSSLPAAARKLARERRRIFEASGLSLEKVRPTPVAAELAEVYAHQPGRMALLTPAFFRAVEDHLRDSFRLWTIRLDGRIAAFACAIHDRLPHRGRNHLVGLFIGVHPRMSDEYRLRSNLYYRLIEEAISEGFEVLDLGRGSPQLRSDLGAQTERLHCLVRHRNPAKNPLMRALFEQIVPPPATGRRGT